jgi:hypothetical protein
MAKVSGENLWTFIKAAFETTAAAAVKLLSLNVSVSSLFYLFRERSR